MNRGDFQQLATLRLEEAKALLDAGYPAGGYYLTGYAIECALKACIAKKTKEHDFPPKPRVVNNIYSHDLKTLLQGADRGALLTRDAPQGSALDKNWAAVLLWSPESRYQIVPQQDAQDLHTAVADPAEGVLAWLQRNW